jgi:hypothetical protein
VLWNWKIEPSDPIPCTVKVNVPFTVALFWSNPPPDRELSGVARQAHARRGSATNVLV